MKKILIFVLVILITGCTYDLYPSHAFKDSAPRVETVNKKKIKRQMRKYDNCGIFKKY